MKKDRVARHGNKDSIGVRIVFDTYQRDHGRLEVSDTILDSMDKLKLGLEKMEKQGADYNIYNSTYKASLICVYSNAPYCASEMY
ncbi:hypothetical protein CSV75_02560 [Sporosarcina sp. P18a]|uniref:hypothetical protein n=1 Tax=Sporosarcina sp. P18a TaxID=2048259 RepID=UPI000C168E73|nr:hypothetical protein [Sporosarcina sp. P18a]PIC80693.1 hypothetical protein CSV75_02560 [Sporosarcina sp. P18a]